LGVIAATGTAYAVLKHKEARRYEAAANEANKRASAHRAAEQAAMRHAQTMEALATKEHQRANLGEDRTRKLAREVADLANHFIAKLFRETAPLLRFDGCFAAATNGVEIRIDMAWILSGIVDPAKERGAIFGRIVGVVAHEWFHFLDTDRGTRPSHQEELLADKFAGKQLAKLDVVPNHFADLLRVFPQSSTHPDGRLRAETVLIAWTTETQKREREAAEPITTIVMQSVTAAEPVVVQASRQRTRNGAVKTGAAKKSAAKKAGKKTAKKAAKKAAPKAAKKPAKKKAE
jgi:hypothetical protein